LKTSCTSFLLLSSPLVPQSEQVVVERKFARRKNVLAPPFHHEQVNINHSRKEDHIKEKETTINQNSPKER
jgi:hypothetical protein